VIVAMTIVLVWFSSFGFSCDAPENPNLSSYPNIQPNFIYLKWKFCIITGRYHFILLLITFVSNIGNVHIIIDTKKIPMP
jgi:hypothetical protein